MSDLSPESRAFLAAHLRDGAPTAADAARVRAALNATHSRMPRAPGARLALVKAGVAGTVIGVVAFAIFAARAPTLEPTRTDAPVVAASPSVRVEAALPAQALDAQVVAPEVRTAPAARAPTRVGDPTRPSARERLGAGEDGPPPALEPPSREPRDLPIETVPAANSDDELRLVSDAQECLRNGNTSGALAALAKRDALFGNTGQLVEEATAARVVALCLSRELVQGREIARALFAQHPRSLHRNRIERGLLTVNPLKETTPG